MPVNTRLILNATALAAAAMTATTVHAQRPETRVRDQIPAEYRWDFSPIYKSWDAWEQGLKDMETKMDNFVKLKGTLASGPAAVAKAYRDLDEIGQLQYLTYRYPQLQRDVNTRDQTVAGRFQRIGAVFAKFDTATAWMTPELLKIPEATMRGWIDQTPALAPYRFTILDNYRRQQHVLDEAGERLLSLGSRSNQTANAAYQELSTSDIQFPTITTSDGKEVKLSPGNYAALLESSPVQADRAKAAAAHVGTYGANIHTYGALYNGVMQRNWYLAQARNFSTTLDAALDDNNIPRSVVETLVQTTRAGTGPLQRYAQLRKKLLGLNEYHLYDGFVPVFRSTTTYPYQKAKDLALASVAPLGAAYGEQYRQFVAGGRIDVYENEGKRSGAYSANVYGVGPYLLLNYNDTMDSMFTFAHEAGHAMHSVLVQRRPALRDQRLHHLRGRGGVDDERTPADGTPAGADHRPEGTFPAAAARGGPDRRHLLHAGAVCRLRAAGAQAGRTRPARHARGAERHLQGPAEDLLRRRRDGGRVLPVDLGAHPALLQLAVLRVPVRHLFCLVGRAVQADEHRRCGLEESGDRSLPDAAVFRRQRPPDGAAEEGRCGPDAEGHRAGRGGPAGHAGDAHGSRSSQDPLSGRHADPFARTRLAGPGACAGAARGRSGLAHRHAHPGRGLGAGAARAGPAGPVAHRLGQDRRLAAAVAAEPAGPARPGTGAPAPAARAGAGAHPRAGAADRPPGA